MFENHRKADEIDDPLMVVRGEKVVQEAEVERTLIPHLDGDCRGDPLLDGQRDGKLMLTFQSTGATLDAQPNRGSFRLLTSLDRGRTWSEEAVTPGPLSGQADVTGFGVLPDDSLLLNWSTLPPAGADPRREEQLRQARAADGWDASGRGSLEPFFHAMYLARSTDGGQTWSALVELDSQPYDLAAGLTQPLALWDGTILLAQGLRHGNGYETVPDCRPLPPEKRGIRGIIYRSTDGGCSWGDRTPMLSNGGEARFLELESGKLLAVVRCQLMDAGLLGSVWDEGKKAWIDPYLLQVPEDQGHKHLWVSESNDKGRTWERPRLVTPDRADCPGELLLLPDGRVLLIYCRRARPDPGVGVMVSRDDGETWDEEKIILKLNRDEGNGTYPSSRLLADGTIVTVTGKNHGNRVQAIRWQVPD